MHAETVSIQTPDGTFSAYLAKPESGQGPAIVLLQEIFGVNAVMRELADEYAAKGFFALVPDLFWRLEPGIQLTDKTDEEWKAAFGYMQRFDSILGIKDVQSAISFIRSYPGVNGKVGAAGYCLGGFLAYLTAVRTDVDAAVSFYGMNIQKHLDDAKTLKKPLMLHQAGQDEFDTPHAQKAVADFFLASPLVTIHTYANVGHAFARPGGAHYDAEAANIANARTIAFFKEHLG
jgi:carboxymethylenebutenolidase